MSLIKLAIASLFAATSLLFSYTPADAARDGLPGRRVGGGSRLLPPVTVMSLAV